MTDATTTRSGPGAIGKYNPDTVDLLVRAASVGIPVKDACEAAGVHQATYFEWLSVHPEFADQIKGAKERRRIEALERILEAGKMPQHWTANAWYLERTMPESYALQHRVTIDARVVVEDISRLAAQLGLDLDPSLIDSVVAEVRQLSGEQDPPARGR